MSTSRPEHKIKAESETSRPECFAYKHTQVLEARFQRLLYHRSCRGGQSPKNLQRVPIEKKNTSHVKSQTFSSFKNRYKIRQNSQSETTEASAGSITNPASHPRLHVSTLSFSSLYKRSSDILTFSSRVGYGLMSKHSYTKSASKTPINFS